MPHQQREHAGSTSKAALKAAFASGWLKFHASIKPCGTEERVLDGSYPFGSNNYKILDDKFGSVCKGHDSSSGLIRVHISIWINIHFEADSHVSHSH